MFTGIVQGKATLTKRNDLKGLSTLTFSLPAALTSGIEIGASIAFDGVCLTVTQFSGNEFSFDVMQESLTLTTLSDLKVGEETNVERAAKEGAEIGGHQLSGHVDFTAKISRIDRPENNHVITFEVPSPWMKYVFSKGYIAINGTSLTITNAQFAAGAFQVWLIPETLRVTSFGAKNVGDQVNIEIDRNTQVIVDTTERFLQEQVKLRL